MKRLSEYTPEEQNNLVGCWCNSPYTEEWFIYVGNDCFVSLEEAIKLPHEGGEVMLEIHPSGVTPHPNKRACCTQGNPKGGEDS